MNCISLPRSFRGGIVDPLERAINDWNTGIEACDFCPYMMCERSVTMKDIDLPRRALVSEVGWMPSVATTLRSKHINVRSYYNECVKRFGL